MKIACISHEASLTGAPKVLFQLAERLADKHEVILVTKEDGPLLQQWMERNHERISCYNMNTSYQVCKLSFLEKVEGAKRFLADHQPDLVYANSAETAEWVIAARLLQIKNIFHLHEMEDGLRSALRTSCFALDVMKYVDLLICVSKDVEVDIYKTLPIKPKRSIVLANFFETDRILEQSKIAQPLPENALGDALDIDRPLICACGLASYRKGVDIFFEVARHFPQLQFLWIGQWNWDRDNPVGQRFQTELLENFFITGQVSNPYYFLGLSQLMVLTSRIDPNPLVVFEALILGKPVICFTETGGSRFILDQAGYVLTGKPNVNTLVQTIQKMILPDGRLYLPEWLMEATQQVRDQYDVSSVFRQFEHLIQEVAAHGHNDRIGDRALV